MGLVVLLVLFATTSAEMLSRIGLLELLSTSIGKLLVHYLKYYNAVISALRISLPRSCRMRPLSKSFIDLRLFLIISFLLPLSSSMGLTLWDGGE